MSKLLSAMLGQISRGKVDSVQIQDSEPDVRNQYGTGIGKHQYYGGEFSIRAKSPSRSSSPNYERKVGFSTVFLRRMRSSAQASGKPDTEASRKAGKRYARRQRGYSPCPLRSVRGGCLALPGRGVRASMASDDRPLTGCVANRLFRLRASTGIVLG